MDQNFAAWSASCARMFFVGQAPSRETDGQPPFVGKSGDFLAAIMGTTKEDMLKSHDFVNLIERWPGKGINGDKFPIIEAKINAKKLLESGAMDGRHVVLLGHNVARAFGVPHFQYLFTYKLVFGQKTVSERVVVVPHPSGINRWWNSEENRMVASKFLYQFGRTR